MNAAPFITLKKLAIATLVVVVVLTAVICWSSVPQPQPPTLLVTKVRPAYSGQKTSGMASLCLSNASGQALFFQPGINKSVGGIQLMWLGVERKHAGEWKLESESQKWDIRDFVTAYSIHYWPTGKALDFQMPVPADGEPRRIVARWLPAPRKFPPVLAQIRQTWNKYMPPKPPQPSSYRELRSAELIVEKLSDYDYTAAFKRLSGDEYKPGQLSNTNFEGFGVGYSDGREASQILPHEKKSP